MLLRLGRLIFAESVSLDTKRQLDAGTWCSSQQSWDAIWYLKMDLKNRRESMGEFTIEFFIQDNSGGSGLLSHSS
jgi:hypothetical protein